MRSALLLEFEVKLTPCLGRTRQVMVPVCFCVRCLCSIPPFALQITPSLLFTISLSAESSAIAKMRSKYNTTRCDANLRPPHCPQIIPLAYILIHPASAQPNLGGDVAQLVELLPIHREGRAVSWSAVRAPGVSATPRTRAGMRTITHGHPIGNNQIQRSSHPPNTCFRFARTP